MPKRDGAETRRQRISQIAKDLQVAFRKQKEINGKEEIDLSRFIGYEMYNTGLTKEKVINYLEILELRGQCELDSENNKIRKPVYQ